MSRHSVGVRLVNLIAERRGWRWTRLAAAQCDIAQKSGVVLVKPLTYLHNENARSFDTAMGLFSVPFKDVILVYPTVSLEVGQIWFQAGGVERSV